MILEKYLKIGDEYNKAKEKKDELESLEKSFKKNKEYLQFSIKFKIPIFIIFSIYNIVFFNSIDYFINDAIAVNNVDWFYLLNKIDSEHLLSMLPFFIKHLLLFNLFILMFFINSLSISNLSSKKEIISIFFLMIITTLSLYFILFFDFSFIFAMNFILTNTILLLMFIFGLDMFFNKHLKNKKQKDLLKIKTNEFSKNKFKKIEEEFLKVEKQVLNDRDSMLNLIDLVFDYDKYNEVVKSKFDNPLSHKKLKELYNKTTNNMTPNEIAKRNYIQSLNRKEIVNS